MEINVTDIIAKSEDGVVEFVMFDLTFDSDGTTYNYEGTHRLPPADPAANGFVSYDNLTKAKVTEWIMAECNTDHFKTFVKEQQAPVSAAPLNKPWSD